MQSSAMSFLPGNKVSPPTAILGSISIHSVPGRSKISSCTGVQRREDERTTHAPDVNQAMVASENGWWLDQLLIDTNRLSAACAPEKRRHACRVVDVHLGSVWSAVWLLGGYCEGGGLPLQCDDERAYAKGVPVFETGMMARDVFCMPSMCVFARPKMGEMLILFIFPLPFVEIVS